MITDGRFRPAARCLARIAEHCSQLALALLLVSLLTTACGTRALRASPQAMAPEPISRMAPSGRLQEVPPPGAVSQLQTALARYQPGVRIQAPADNSLLEGGPWTLELAVRDWPLTDAGALGLGAHVVVQIDDRDPIRLSQAPAPGATTLRVELPELGAGSHRISAYAARPWGEAAKAPGAFDQIRLARVASNSLSQPAPGSPQLIPTAAMANARHEPVLVDWLLRDAPLQGLRPGDGSWRLRITVNGDSFLVDDSTPLWLRGWHSGSNAVLLELVDGQGAPLNPPFNSLVREVWIDPLAPAAAWEAPSLSAQHLAELLGEQPVEPASSNAEATASRASQLSDQQTRVRPPGAGLTAVPASEPTPAQQSPAKAAPPDETETAGEPDDGDDDGTIMQTLPPTLGAAADQAGQPERAGRPEQSRQAGQSEPGEPIPPPEPIEQRVPDDQPRPASAQQDRRPAAASDREPIQADGGLTTAERQAPWTKLRQRWNP